MEKNTDFIATELLQELKTGNARKDAQIINMQRNLMRVIYGFLIAIFAVVTGFLLYLNQYDYSATSEFNYEATGVYALVDSEGNVIAEDLTQEDMEYIMEVLKVHGKSTSVRKDTEVED